MIIEISFRADSFALNHTERKGDCIDYAIAAAALLSDNGYTPNFLGMRNPEAHESHAVFLYKSPLGYGALGNTPLPPIYPDVSSLINRIEDTYGFKYTQYSVMDLDATFPNRSWINSTENLNIRTDNLKLINVD